MAETNYEKDGTNILVPIKALIQSSAELNGANYADDEFNLLRRYFITCLNMAYFPDTGLETYVNKFTTSIHSIICCKNNNYIPTSLALDNTALLKWSRDSFVVFKNVLYINSFDKYTENNESYEILFFQAVTSVLINTTEKMPSLAIGVTQLLADRIYNYDKTGRRFFPPKSEELLLGNHTLTLRSGFTNNKIIATLLKQLFFLTDINELSFSKSLFQQGYTNALKVIRTNSNVLSLIRIMDEIQNLINAEFFCYLPEDEWCYIRKFEIEANDYFNDHKAPNYIAFLALVPDKELIKELRETENN